MLNFNFRIYITCKYIELILVLKWKNWRHTWNCMSYTYLSCNMCEINYTDTECNTSFLILSINEGTAWTYWHILRTLINGMTFMHHFSVYCNYSSSLCVFAARLPGMNEQQKSNVRNCRARLQTGSRHSPALHISVHSSRFLSINTLNYQSILFFL